MSKELGELVVRKCTAEEFKDCDVVFSGLDSDVAGDVGMSYNARYTGESSKLYAPSFCRHQRLEKQADQRSLGVYDRR